MERKEGGGKGEREGSKGRRNFKAVVAQVYNYMYVTQGVVDKGTTEWTVKPRVFKVSFRSFSEVCHKW